MWLTYVVDQLISGKVVENIVRRCVLTNSVRLSLSKHLPLPIVGQERCSEGTEAKEANTKGSPRSSLTPLFLVFLITVASIGMLMLLLGEDNRVLMLDSNL